MGRLFICATPIGNLEDASIRLLRTLKEADLIACEDTRHTSKLLNYYNIKNRMISYHEHSQVEREEELIAFLKEGKNVALVSDAGMPGISDPGMGIIKRAIEEEIPIEIIPGPSAVTAALALSGFDSERFIFEGFLSRKASKRRIQLEQLKEEKRTVIVYEAPHRLLATLEDLEAVMGAERHIAVARELTKKYEEVIRGTVADIKEHFITNSPRGEICLIISGQKEKIEPPGIAEIVEQVEELINRGMEKKQALKLKASEHHVPKTLLYNYLVNKLAKTD